MKGHLTIFVDGYKTYHNHMLHIFDDGVAIPDKMIPPTIHTTGTMEWYADGWAVGDNSRGRYCARLNEAKIRRFNDYDEAVEYIYARQRKRKNERFSLVYVVPDVRGITHHHRVSSMDEIIAIDAQLDVEAQSVRERRAAFSQEHPGLAVLDELYQKTTAFQLSELLYVIQTRGLDAAKQSLPKATYYRSLDKLRKAGLLP